jgi:beta-lactamase class D
MMTTYKRSNQYKLLVFGTVLSLFLPTLRVVNAAEGPNPEPDYFAGQKGCFLLYNMKTKKFEKVIGEKTCRERFVACSTFKVPLSVMAFDSGILKDENQIGKKAYLEAHNQDHNAKTWMRDSVVWFSQRLTRITREMTYLETSPKGFKLSGKTGSNYYDKNYNEEKRRGLGWFVSHLQNGQQEYIAVANLSDMTPTEAGSNEKFTSFGGQRAKRIVKTVLSELGLW